LLTFSFGSFLFSLPDFSHEVSPPFRSGCGMGETLSPISRVLFLRGLPFHASISPVFLKQLLPFFFPEELFWDVKKNKNAPISLLSFTCNRFSKIGLECANPFPPFFLREFSPPSRFPSMTRLSLRFFCLARSPDGWLLQRLRIRYPFSLVCWDA